MGRAARNHGGTGGHGYFPLAGERPNYNLHVLNDRALCSLVNNNHGKIPSKEQLRTTFNLPERKLGWSSKQNNQHSMKAAVLDVKSTFNKDNMVSFTPMLTKTTKENSSERKEMTSVELPRFKDEQPLQSKKPKVKKLHQEAHQTDDNNESQPINLIVNKPTMRQLPKMKVSNATKKQQQQHPLSSVEQPLSSAQHVGHHQVTSVHQLVTSVQEPLITVQQPVISLPVANPVSSVEQPLSSAQHVGHHPVTSVHQLVTSDQDPLITVQQPVISLRVANLVSSVEQPLSSAQHVGHHPVTSVNQLVTSVQEPLITVQQQEISIPVTFVQPPSSLFVTSGLSFLQPNFVPEVSAIFSPWIFFPVSLTSTNYHWIPERHQIQDTANWQHEVQMAGTQED